MTDGTTRFCVDCGAAHEGPGFLCEECDQIILVAPVAEGELVDELLGRYLDDRYELEATLGEGGAGRVYRARQVDLDRPISFYSPVKNNVLDGAAKARKGQVPGCAAAGESDLYVFLFPVDYISCGRCRRSQSRSVDIIQINHNKFMMFRRSHKFWSVPSIT